MRESLANKRQVRAILRQQEESARNLIASGLDHPVADYALHHPDIDFDLMAQEPPLQTAAVATSTEEQADLVGSCHAKR